MTVLQCCHSVMPLVAVELHARKSCPNTCVLCCVVLSCLVLCCVVLSCLVLSCVVLCCVVSCCVVSCRVVLCGGRGGGAGGAA